MFSSSGKERLYFICHFVKLYFSILGTDGDCA